MPRGFVSDLSSLIASPSVLLLTNRNAYEERILREAQAFVYTLNSQVQTEYIRSNSDFLDVLVHGGEAKALGRTYNVLGLDATRERIADVQSQLPADSPARDAARLRHEFAGQASAALGLAHQALGATAHPVRLVQRSTSGRSYLLGSQVQSYGLAISLAFVTLLLGAAVLTLERDENVLARLLRSGARPALLVAEKVALCAIVGCALGLLLALGFGVAAEISSSGAAWTRVPLLLVPLAATGAAFGALGCVVGAAARDLRAASLVGVALITPIVLVGLVPRTVSPLAADVSELLPFAPAARAFGAALFDSAPLSNGARASAHLLLLTAVARVRRRSRSSGAFSADDRPARLGRERRDRRIRQQRRDRRREPFRLLGAHPQQRARPGARERQP